MSAAENIRVAEEVVSVLADYDVSAVVIGAIAMAAHHYVRFTEDIDLGVTAEIETLSKVASELSERGYQVEYRIGEMDDPLAGVIDISGSFGLVQVVNFFERFPAVINDSIEQSSVLISDESQLRIPPLEHLIALKLYAGGSSSDLDIVELIKRNKDVSLDTIRNTCAKYRLRGIDRILEENE